MRLKKLLLIMIVVLLSFSTVCTALTFDSSDFNAVVNDDLIQKYKDKFAQDEIFSVQNIQTDSIKARSEDIIQKIVSDEIILDETPTSKLTTTFLKKIYDEENKKFFESQFQEKGIEASSYYQKWAQINPSIASTIDVEVLTYLINHDEKALKLKSDFENIKSDVINAVDFYIDSMSLTDKAKEKMKGYIDNISFEFYGVNKDLHSFFDDGFAEYYLNVCEEDKNNFIDLLKKQERTFSLKNKNLYKPNAFSHKNSVIICPAVALLHLNPLNIDLFTSVKLILTHEIGHFWNHSFVSKDLESMAWDFESLKYLSYSNPELANEKLGECTNQYKETFNYNSNIEGLSQEDLNFLNDNAQKIFNAFNITTKRSLSTVDLLQLQAYDILWNANSNKLNELDSANNLKDGENAETEDLTDTLMNSMGNVLKQCVEKARHLNSEGDTSRTFIKLDAMALFSEAAADNFSLEVLTRYANLKKQDVSQIFFNFARGYWSTVSDKGLVEEYHPIGEYRINIGLNLCDAYRKWAIEDKNEYKYPEFTQVVQTDSGKIRIKAYEGIISPGCNFKAEYLKSGTKDYNEVFKNLDSKFKKIIEGINIYDLYIEDLCGNKISQFDNYITLYIEIPESYNKTDLKALHISEGLDNEFNEWIENIDGVDYLAFRTNHFSPYAILDKDTDAEAFYKVVLFGTVSSLTILTLIGLGSFFSNKSKEV